jgi:SagB-type dehydrogenase family enzyme
MAKSTSAESIHLPSPRLRGDRSLEETLTARRSVRAFANTPLTDEEISQLLWAAQGVTHPSGRRAAPSAGAVYPLEAYVARDTGLWHYEPGRHRLTQTHSVDLRPSLHGIALGQDALIEAPAVFVITAVTARMRSVYGKRAERYVHMEVGHAAENLLLQAVSLDLGGVLIGAFNDDWLNKVLRLPRGEEAMYLVPVGRPR